MELNPLIPIGTKIKVDKSKIENLLPNKLLNELPRIINGEIVDYKMTDGMDIGYVLKIENNQKVWIFSHELDDQTKKEYKINYFKTKTTTNTKDIIGKIKINYEINGNRNIKTLANPINLITWIGYTLKDIF